MHLELKTHQRASILLRLLRQEHSRLETMLLDDNPAFAKAHIRNEMDAVNGLYTEVYNASTTNPIPEGN